MGTTVLIITTVIVAAIYLGVCGLLLTGIGQNYQSIHKLEDDIRKRKAEMVRYEAQMARIRRSDG